MKYDSSMANFHKDIIAALRYMLKDDSEITEKFSPDSGPVTLRDYLKTFYSKSFDTPVSDKMRFTCTPTIFKIAFDDMLLNNKGEKELTMTWSQVAKFIRDNWDEVFKKSESAAEQPSPQLSYIDKLREEYPKVTETDEWFDTVYCPSEMFDGDGVNDPSDDKCSYATKDFESCRKCWRERCPADVEFLTDPSFEKEYFENYPAEAAAIEDVPKEKTICDDCINNDENCIKMSEDKCIGYTSESDTILNPAPESEPTYKDIFLEHYPNFDVSRFDEFAESLCVACCFDDGGAACPFPGNDECKTHWESECLFEWRDKTYEYVLFDKQNTKK